MSYKYRYVPMVILESNGPEALKPVMKANDDGHLVPTGEVVEKPYDELVMAKVSSGGGHTLSLRADGSIWAYGLNEHGQLGTNSNEINETADGQRILGDDDPVEIQTWVKNSSGKYEREYHTELSEDGVTVREKANVIFVDVSAGKDHSLAVDSDGNVWAAGSNEYGQLGLTGVDELPYFVKILDAAATSALSSVGAKIVAVSAGNGYSLALASDGSVFAWGRNDRGQLGLHHTEQVDMPTKLSLINVNAISAGEDHSLFAMFDGYVYATGSNAYGKLGIVSAAVPLEGDVDAPIFLDDPQMTSVLKVGAGNDHSMALTYGARVLTWGSNEDGRLGRELADNAAQTAEPGIINELSYIMDISAGMDHNLAVNYNGELYAWGNNRDGQLGLGSATSNLWVAVPQMNVSYLKDANIVLRSISAGGAYSSISDTTGQVYGMGDYTKARYNGDNAIALYQNDTLSDTPIIVGEKGQPSSKHQVLVHVGEDVVVDFILSHRFNLFTDFWSRYTPQFTNINGDVAYRNYDKVLEAGEDYVTGDGLIYTPEKAFITEEDGTVREKIYDAETLLDENRFVVHGVSYGFTQIVLRAGNQTVVYYVNVIPYNDPEKQSINIVAPMISSGQQYTLALRSDGTVWAWGDNQYGQLGHTIDPKEAYSLLPVEVNFPGLEPDEHIVSISAGEYHALALTNKGRLYAWGSNAHGELGLRLTWGFTGDQVEPDRLSQPTVVTLSDTATGSDSRVVKMVAGITHSVALTESGRVYTWGSNSQGQLGMNWANSVHTGTPQQVPGMSKVIDLSEGARGDTVRVVRYDGTMWGWGLNLNGQINTESGRANYMSPIIIKLGTDSLRREMGRVDSEVNTTDLTIVVNAAANREYALYNGTTQVTAGFTVKDARNRTVSSDTGWYSSNLGRLTFYVDAPADMNDYHVEAVEVGIPEGQKIIRVADGKNHSLALLTDGSIITWGSNTNNQLANPDAEQPTVDGDGNNTNDNPKLLRNDPMYVVGFDGSEDSKYAVAIAANANHALAITAEEHVWTWGENGWGRLGQGDTVQTYPTPVQIMDTEAVRREINVNGNKSVRYETIFRLDEKGEKIPMKAQAITAGGAFSTVASIRDAAIDNGFQPGDGLTASDILVGEKLRVDDNDHIGTLYAYGNNERGQIGINERYTTDQLQLAANTSLPRIVLETLELRPQDMVLPQGGQQIMKVSTDKFHVANGIAATIQDYEWEVNTEFDNEGNALIDPTTNTFTTNTIGEVSTTTTTGGIPRYVLTARKMGTAVVQAIDKESGYRLSTTLQVVSRDSVRAEKVFVDNTEADNQAIAGSLSDMVAKGYLKPEEFTFMNSSDEQEAIPALNRVPEDLHEAAQVKDSTLPDNKNALENAFVVYVTPDKNDPKGTVTVRIVLRVNTDDVDLWMDRGNGYVEGQSDNTITDLNATWITKQKFAPEGTMVGANVLDPSQDAGLAQMPGGTLYFVDEVMGETEATDIRTTTYLRFEGVPADRITDVYLRFKNGEGAQDTEGYDYSVSTWMKLVLVERPEDTAMEQVWVGDNTTDQSHTMPEESWPMPAPTTYPDKYIGPVWSTDKVLGQEPASANAAMRYPNAKGTDYENNFYYIISDETTDKGVGLDENGHEIEIDLNTLYVYGEAAQVGSTIGVDNKIVNADHIAEAKAAGAAHSTAERAYKGLVNARDNMVNLDTVRTKLLGVNPDVDGEAAVLVVKREAITLLRKLGYLTASDTLNENSELSAIEAKLTAARDNAKEKAVKTMADYQDAHPEVTASIPTVDNTVDTIRDAFGNFLTHAGNWEEQTRLYAEGIYIKIHQAYLDTQRTAMQVGTYEIHTPLKVTSQLEPVPAPAVSTDYTLDIYRESFATRLDSITATLGTGSDATSYQAHLVYGNQYLLVLPAEVFDNCDPRRIENLTATAAMPELAYVSYRGTVSNENRQFPGELLGSAIWNNGFYPSRASGYEEDDTLTVVIRVYTNAEKTQYVEQSYELNIVVVETEYYVYLDEDFQHPLELRRVEDNGSGSPEYRYVGNLSSDKAVFPAKVTVVAPREGSMVQVDNSIGTTTRYHLNKSTEEFTYYTDEYLETDPNADTTGMRHFNEHGWDDIGFSVGRQTGSTITNVAEEMVRLYHADADSRIGDIIVTFNESKPINDDKLLPDGTDANGNPLYKLTADYDKDVDEYYVAITELEMENAYQIDVSPLLPYTTIYGVYTSKADAEAAVETVKSGSVDLTGSIGQTFEYTAGGSHLIPLDKVEPNTPFYIVSVPKNSSKYGAQIYTLTIRKLAAKIIEATTSAGAIARPVEVTIPDPENPGSTITVKRDFRYYEANDPANPYLDDSDGRPTFVVKVRYPDSGKNATLKLTTENTLTWVGLDAYDDQLNRDNTVYKKANSDRHVELPVILADETERKAVYYLRTKLEANGLSAEPQEYTVVLEYAERGSGLLELKEVVDYTTTDPNSTLVGKLVEDLIVREVLDEEGNLDYYYLAIPKSSTPGPIQLQAVAGHWDADGNPVEDVTSMTSFLVPNANGQGSYSRDNDSDSRIHVAWREVDSDLLDVDRLENGQEIFIRVVDESGIEQIYTLKVFFQSESTEVQVRTVNTALGNKPLDAESKTEADLPDGKVSFYTTLVKRDAATVPFRITAVTRYTSVWMPKVNGEPVWFPVGENINDNTYNSAIAGRVPTEADWKANVDGKGDPIEEILDELALGDNTALRKAMETGIYLPFYVRSESGTVQLQLLMMRWDFSNLGIRTITADYDWGYDTTYVSGIQRFEKEPAQRVEEETETQTWTIAVPDNVSTLDLTVTPELAAVEHILIGETNAALLENPNLWSAADYTAAGYTIDTATGARTKTGVVIGKAEDADHKDSVPVDLYVPGEKGTEHIVCPLTRPSPS